jgi:hypothetical protein
MAENVTHAFAAILQYWKADEPAVEALCRLLLIDGLGIAEREPASPALR